MIRARLVKRFAGFSLDVEFEARPGVTVLYGLSGAGKTVTLNCLAGFAAPDEGRILLNEEILFDAAARVDLPPRKRHCGYVFQDHALFPHMTLFQNLEFGAAQYPRLERHRRVNEMLERFGLSGFARSFPAQVSGGQKQRCSIARALMTEPRMLLLDEPARGLDAILRGDLYRLAAQIRSGFRIPILLVTHDLAECFAIGDTLLIFAGGRIVQAGAPREVYERPRSPEIARLLGMSNLFEAEILALDPGRNTSRIRMLGSEFTAHYLPGRLLGDRITAAIPTEQVKLFAQPGANRMAVSAPQVTHFADRVRVEFAGGLTAEVGRGEFPDTKQYFAEIPAGAIRVAG